MRAGLAGARRAVADMLLAVLALKGFACRNHRLGLKIVGFDFANLAIFKLEPLT